MCIFFDKPKFQNVTLCVRWYHSIISSVMFWPIRALRAEIWPVEHRICESHPQFYEAEESFKPGFRRKSRVIYGFSWRQVKTGS